jgi:hypothetical protein
MTINIFIQAIRRRRDTCSISKQVIQNNVSKNFKVALLSVMMLKENQGRAESHSNIGVEFFNQFQSLIVALCHINGQIWIPNLTPKLFSRTTEANFRNTAELKCKRKKGRTRSRKSQYNPPPHKKCFYSASSYRSPAAQTSSQAVEGVAST